MGIKTGTAGGLRYGRNSLKNLPTTWGLRR